MPEVIVALTLICRGAYRGVVEFVRDLLGVSVSLGCVHDVLQAATRQASIVNQSQDLHAGFLTCDRTCARSIS